MAANQIHQSAAANGESTAAMSRRKAVESLEAYATGKDGRRYVMRPIRPSDAPSLIRGYDAMSPRAKWFRMLSGLPQLPPERARAYCAPDEASEFCVVLEGQGPLEGEILGGARVSGIGPGLAAEFSVSLRPEAHGLGLARQALETAIQVAKEAGCSQVWGSISSANAAMIALARRCGFQISRDPDDLTLLRATLTFASRS